MCCHYYNTSTGFLQTKLYPQQEPSHDSLFLLTFHRFLTNIKQLHMVATLIERNTFFTNHRIIYSTVKLRLQYVVLVHYTTDYKTRNSWSNMDSKYIAGVGTDIENSCSIMESPNILTAYCTFVPIPFPSFKFHTTNDILTHLEFRLKTIHR